MQTKPYSKKDFAWARWTAGDIKKLPPLIFAHKKKVYAEIKKILKDKRTFENTVYALESSDYKYSSAIRAIDVLSLVSPVEPVRKTAIKTIDLLNKKLVDLEYDKGIYRALLEYKDGANYRKEKLLPEEKKLFLDMLTDYKRMGFDLPEEKQKKVKELMKQLSKLSNDFSKNLNEYHDHILATREELEGLPERYIDSLKKERNKYKVTLEYPDLGPFMAHSMSERKRRELMDKYFKKGGMKNMRLLEEALRLRGAKAKLLGYQSHAHYVLERRMAKNPAAVLKFIKNLEGKLRPKAGTELAELKRLKREMTGDKKAEIKYYDGAFYAERLKEKKHNVHGEKIREYFPFDKVVAGTFAIYQKLFGVKFKELKGYKFWHDDVRLFSVSDKNGGIRSYFMLDLYPRKNKYGHACASQIITGRTKGFRDDNYVAPLALMLANFPKPQKDSPSLLSHGEVETFFHEFGHIMHSVLTRGLYASQSGYNTVWDFVEAPSQMLENWTWSGKMLKLLSRHYKTGKPLPEKDLKNLLRAKNFLACRQNMRQLALAYFDLLIHSKKNTKSVAKLAQDISYAYTGVREPKHSIFPAGFGHLMGGYDSGYYSYMWSLVFAADMFTRFKKEGLLNAKTGADYRREILEVGSGREEMESVKKFLGRAPNNKAFLKEIGVS